MTKSITVLLITKHNKLKEEKETNSKRFFRIYEQKARHTHTQTRTHPESEIK